HVNGGAGRAGGIAGRGAATLDPDSGGRGVRAGRPRRTAVDVEHAGRRDRRAVDRFCVHAAIRFARFVLRAGVGVVFRRVSRGVAGAAAPNGAGGRVRGRRAHRGRIGDRRRLASRVEFGRFSHAGHLRGSRSHGQTATAHADSVLRGRG